MSSSFDPGGVTLERPRLAPAPTRRRRLPMLALGLTSVLLHGAVVWTLLPHGGRSGLDAPPAIEVELVDQAAELQGAATAPPTQPPPTPQTPPPPPQAKSGDVSPSPPPRPQPQRDAPPGPPVSQTAINLGGAEEDQEGLSVTGRNVVPPRPDAAIRNRPPHYPADAVRRGSQGTVGLRVHVTEVGIPGWIDVIVSSGDPSLDQAARDAVSLWHFQPARAGGAAVPFDYDLSVRFQMGDR